MDERSSVDGNPGVDGEAMRRLKKFRGVAKREFTKAVNRLTDVIEVDEDEAVIRAVESQLDRAFDRFKEACETFSHRLDDDDDIEESITYFREGESRYVRCKDRIAVWFQTVKKLVPAENDNSDVGPDDSCSQVKSASRSGSFSSKANRSDTIETRFKSLKRIAVLHAEASMLERHERLENEEIRLNQMKKKLALDTQLAKLKAEVQAFNDFERNTDDRSDSVSKQVKIRSKGNGMVESRESLSVKSEKPFGRDEKIDQVPRR